MQTSHHAGAAVAVLAPPAALMERRLSPILMAQYLRETTGSLENARCFAREMHEQAAWANEAWGAFWADVVQLV